MTRRALVTGATGYLGGQLVRRLVADGCTVHALVREGSDASALPAAVTLHRLDGSPARLAAAVADAAPDIVFHLASLYLADHAPDQVEALVASNLLFPAQLAQAMTDAGVTRLINAGTASQHSGGQGYDPASLYAATKQACEDLLGYYHRARGLSVTTLKIYDTYGEGDPRRKVTRLLIDAVLSGQRLAMSPGEQVLDMTHADDIVDAFLLAGERLADADRPEWAEYLLSGERLTLRALAALVEAAIGTPAATFGARPYRDREVMIPTVAAAAQRLPGWHPRRTLEAGLAALVAERRAAHSG